MSKMRNTFALAGVALATLAAAPPARACSVCGCGDPLLISNDPAAISGQLRLQLDTEYLRVKAGNEEDPAATDDLTQWSYRLNAVYRPVDGLALTVTLPFVTKTMKMSAGGATTPVSDVTGLGDVEIAARWALLRAADLGSGRLHELALSGGTSTPTGANDVQADGERIDEHGQPGTGSWGPFAGIHYRFEQRDWSAFASVSGRWHSMNSEGYRYGSAVLWSVHGQWFATRRLALDLGVDGRHAAADADSGETVVNTGGTIVSLAPGAYVNAYAGAWLFVRAQVPVVKNLAGVQDQFPTFLMGLQYQVR